MDRSVPCTAAWAPACPWRTPARAPRPGSVLPKKQGQEEGECMRHLGCKAKAHGPETGTPASHSPHPSLHPATEELAQLIAGLGAKRVSFLPSLCSGKWALFYVNSPNPNSPNLNCQPKISRNSRNSYLTANQATQLLLSLQIPPLRFLFSAERLPWIC